MQTRIKGALAGLALALCACTTPDPQAELARRYVERDVFAELLKSGTVTSCVEIPEELLGVRYRDLPALSEEERRELLKKSFFRMKHLRAQVGIPTGINAHIPTVEADRKYRTFLAKTGPDLAERRWVRSHYSEVFLNEYDLLETGNHTLTAFYLNEHVESGCENPLVAGKALSQLKGYLPDTTYEAFRHRVRERLLVRISQYSEASKRYCAEPIEQMEALQRQL
jgi:hypothetical protein